jgi:hypothetical protein
VTEDEKVQISIGNRRHIKINTGVTLFGIAAAIFMLGGVAKELKDARSTLQKVVTKEDLQVIHAEQRENRAAVIRLSAKEDSTRQELVIVKERSRSIEAGQQRIERKVEQLDADRIRYKWDRSHFSAPRPKKPPQLTDLRDVLLRGGPTP